MLRQTANYLKHRAIPQMRNQSTSINSDVGKWDLLVGVQIERLPIITKALTKLERDYQELLRQIEFENSYKSDFEIKGERDEAMAQLLKEGKAQVDLDAVAQQTAQDLEDLWKTELSKFQPASRTTEADKKNDLKSTERKLDHSLTFIMEQQIGKEKHFLLPQGKIGTDETLYDAAHRIIKEMCGDSIKVSIYGKAPCGFYKYKYPKEIRGDIIGAKVFFYRALLKAGQVDAKCINFEWLDKAELLAKVNEHNNYKRSIRKFII